MILQSIWSWLPDSGGEKAIVVFLIFSFFVGVLSIVRRLITGRLSRLAKTTDTVWDDHLLRDIQGPSFILILIIAGGLTLQLAPEEFRKHPMAVYGMKIGLILAAAWIVERIVALYLRSSALPVSVSSTTRVLLITVFRVFLASIGVLIVLDTLGISITPLLASLGVGSVAVALALQDTLTNFFGGMYILIDKPIRIGDFVQIEDDIEGYVTKIGWRSTQIRQLPNIMVVIPNSKIASSKLRNYDLPEQETALLVQVGVSYNCDLKVVEKVTIETAQHIQQTVEGAVPDFIPFTRYHTFADSSVNFTVILRVKSMVDNFLVKHEFIKALHARYKAEGIEIPFPQRVVTLLPNQGGPKPNLS